MHSQTRRARFRACEGIPLHCSPAKAGVHFMAVFCVRGSRLRGRNRRPRENGEPCLNQWHSAIVRVAMAAGRLSCTTSPIAAWVPVFTGTTGMTATTGLAAAARNGSGCLDIWMTERGRAAAPGPARGPGQPRSGPPRAPEWPPIAPQVAPKSPDPGTPGAVLTSGRPDRGLRRGRWGRELWRRAALGGQDCSNASNSQNRGPTTTPSRAS